MDIKYTPKMYANEYHQGLVTCQTVRNWIRRWETKGGLPLDHRLETTPAGRKLIIVSHGQNDSLLEHLINNR